MEGGSFGNMPFTVSEWGVIRMEDVEQERLTT